MARTKQTARQSTGGKLPPPPPPPPAAEGVTSLDLLSTKMTSKKISKAEIDKDTVFDGQTMNTSLPLVSTLEVMRTQSHTAMPVTVLNLSGTDQLTDMFWYMVKQWRISMPRLTRISLNGCYNLTNAGIRYLVKAFPRVQYVELCGIKNLTEESLMNIISHWEEFLVQINVSGTSIGMIPPGYQGSIKMSGCPMVSPTETLYKATSVKRHHEIQRHIENNMRTNEGNRISLSSHM